MHEGDRTSRPSHQGDGHVLHRWIHDRPAQRRPRKVHRARSYLRCLFPGVRRHAWVECWGDDVPDGKFTDFRRAAQAKQGESVVFSWVECPDKDTRDAGMAKFMQDPRMEVAGDCPFDGKRMILGSFKLVVSLPDQEGPELCAFMATSASGRRLLPSIPNRRRSERRLSRVTAMSGNPGSPPCARHRGAGGPSPVPQVSLRGRLPPRQLRPA